MPKPPPPSHRIKCAEILAEIWPREQVAKAMGISLATLHKWGVRGLPTPQHRLVLRLLSTGAPVAEVAEILGITRQEVYRLRAAGSRETEGEGEGGGGEE